MKLYERHRRSTPHSIAAAAPRRRRRSHTHWSSRRSHYVLTLADDVLMHVDRVPMALRETSALPTIRQRPLIALGIQQRPTVLYQAKNWMLGRRLEHLPLWGLRPDPVEENANLELPTLQIGAQDGWLLLV